MTCSILSILCQFVLFWQTCTAQELSALRMIGMSQDDFNSLEHYSDLSIDQVIMQAMGGPDVSAQKMIGANGMFLAELDMNLTEEQFRHMYQPPEYGDPMRMPYFEPKKRKKRKAVRRLDLRWSNAEIPYYFASEHFTEKEKYLIKVSMREWEKYTCIRFREATRGDHNYVRFQNGQGCNSQLGMVGGEQILNLDVNGCRWKGLYLHEIGHAIGLVHEHQLPNRDDFIEILYENVSPSMRIWFNKYSEKEINQFDVPYEYSSVMHYGITAFAKDGKSQTIRAKDRTKEQTIGKVWRKELAFSDVKAVNRMYQCSVNCPKSIRCNGGGFVDQNCKCICPDGTSNCQSATQNSTVDDDSCYNDYNSWNCYIWATQGECDLNPKFMHKYCKKACGQCGSSAKMNEGNHVATWSWQWLGMLAYLLPRNWTVVECQDVFDSDKCHSWKLNGDCIANEKWMKENCKKTCGECSKDNTTEANTNCRNRHSNKTECDIWARKGECQINKRWMLKNCQKSCRVCDQLIGDDPRTRNVDEEDDDYHPKNRNTDEEVDCDDEHNTRECQRWAARRECQRNPKWMIPNCRKSCRRCHDGSCKNLHDDKKCRLWAKDGECFRNPDWMSYNCAKSCNTCELLEDSDSDNDRSDDSEETETVTTNTGDASCQNDHKDSECDDWAKNGHCDINPSYMKVNCKRSCNVCTDVREDDGNDDSNDDSNDVGNDESNDDGRDDDNDGGNNDSKDNGNDDGNDDTMVGRVPDDDEDSDFDVSDDYDDHDDTDEYDDDGDDDEEPIVTSTFTTTTGQPSVSTIPVSTTAATRVLGTCVDKHASCKDWARSGYCTSNPSTLLKDCPQSCKICKSSCRDEHLLCQGWTNDNQCRKNPGFMLRFCQKSCKFCT